MGDVVTMKPGDEAAAGTKEFSFADFPKSVAELRAAAEDDAGLLTPRDLLINMLRSIDSGEYPGLVDMVIVWGRDQPDDDFQSYGITTCGYNRTMRIAALESAKLEQFGVIRGAD